MKTNKIIIFLGIVIGIIIAYTTLNYDGSTTEYLDGKGNTINTVTELDFAYLTNFLLIVTGTVILLYVGKNIFSKLNQKIENKN